MELKKFPIKGYMSGASISSIIIFLFMILLYWTAVLEGEGVIYTQLDCINMVNVLVNDVFLIFVAAMFSNYIIGEYSKGTINILFTYPINRKKLIWSKILLVCSFMIITMIIANLFVLVSLFIINNYTNTMTVVIDMQFLSILAMKIAANSISFSLISTLCLYFGMIKKIKSCYYSIFSSISRYTRFH